MFTSPSEVFINVFGIDIYYYGILMSIAVLVGTFFSNFIRGKFYPEISENTFFDVVFVTLISGFAGARLYYCIFNFAYYSNHINEIINIRQGGLSIHGGILFGLIAGIIYLKFKKLPILKMADIFAYGLILAQAIGRWGNFFNSEAFGRPTDIFCKLYIPISHRPLEYVNYEYFHPTFLYESILDVFIFFILLFVVRKYIKNVDGVVFCSYLILYSIARVLVESLRIDSIFYVANLPLPIFVSIIVLACAIITMTFILFRNRKL